MTASPAVPISRYIAFFSLAVAGCGIDLWTKHWIFARLGVPWPDGDSSETEWIWEGYFGLETALNPGALFGMGAGHPYASYCFAGLSVVAVLGVLYWLFVVGAGRDWLLTIALGCVTGGIFGNLYDRLGLWHATLSDGSTITGVRKVRDWILWTLQGSGGRDWPNFNIADSLLVCGAALLIWHAMFCGKAAEVAKSQIPNPKS
ncbi:MAG: signal peptidase II [Planctomycetes bacterium]|nr:signal peptidase II [Planctomycetota bacterium]